MIIFTIALNTFREAVRDKILYVLLAFGGLLIVGSKAIGYVSFGQEYKIMADMGLAAIWMFSGMVSIFVGTGLIYKEIDKRTIYTILSKPAQRWQFLLGKYLGLALTTLVNMLVLSTAFLAYLWLSGGLVTVALLEALLMIFFEMLVVTAIAIFFSSASTPILSAIFTTIIFFFGQLTKWIVDLAGTLQASAATDEARERYRVIGGWLYKVYLLLPNLHTFNIRQEAVHAEPGVWIGAHELWYGTLWGLAYTAAVLLAAQLIFSRRNF
ncbi:MAG TPA: ABC transporter permease [Planctomycetota bacterium]|nr:ABC transporter permease [Planctomycetota bacterium]